MGRRGRSDESKREDTLWIFRTTATETLQQSQEVWAAVSRCEHLQRKASVALRSLCLASDEGKYESTAFSGADLVRFDARDVARLC